MKRTLSIFVLIILIYILIGNIFSKKIVIPDEAIRIRVIANSNSNYDQYIKQAVKENLIDNIINLINTNDSIDVFRNKIINNIDKFSADIEDVLAKNDYKPKYDINYGLNYFPEKYFKGIKYEEGYYESLVVTLGDGLGDNWWCILFPPLCFIEADEYSDVEYTTFVGELINKYF